MTGIPAWRDDSSAAQPGHKVIVPTNLGDVIVDDQTKRQPVRAWRLKRWEQWRAIPTKTKVSNGIALAVVSAIGSLALTYFDPIAVFALTLVGRLLFYGFARYYVERRAYDAAVATRSFAVIQVFAYLAVIMDVFQSQATWRYGAFGVLAVLLTMEVVGIRTWYSKWMEREQRLMRQMHPLIRAMSPKAGSLLTAFACLIVEFSVFLIMWSKPLDEFILWLYHAVLWMIAHPVVSLFLIAIAVVLIIVTKIYVVIVWIFTNPVSIIGIMVITGIIGIIIH